MTDSTGGRRLAEVTLDNGEVVYASPLSPFAIQAITTRAKELYPDPDPTLYERPIKGAPEGAPPEPLEMNDEWVRDEKIAKRKQANYTNWALVQASILDTPEGKDVTMVRYAETIAALRRVGSVTADDWSATILFCLVTTHADVDRIYSTVNQLPTPEGVSEKIRFFRYDGGRQGLSGGDREETPPSPTENAAPYGEL